MRTKTINVIILLCLVILTASIRAQESADDAVPVVTSQDILTKYINALGGREALERLTSRVCTGKQVTDFTSRQHPTYESLYLEAHARVPTSFCLEIWSDGGGYREGFDGETGWVKDKCGVRGDQRLKHSKLAFLLNPQGALYIDRYFPGLSYAGASTVNGVEVHALRPDSLPPEHYTLYFSAKSGLLVAIGYYWSLEDYREVDGVMFPHRISTSRKGGSTVYELETVTHNAALDDSLFAIPAESD